LTGCAAALSRFISKSAERALPFFKILKKAGPVKWTPEAEAALQDLKAYLSSAPTLVAPKPQEPLLLYLAATNQVVSAALVAQREVGGGEAIVIESSGVEPALPPSRPVGSGGEGPQISADEQEGVARKKMAQRPIYFVSSLLQGARSRYYGGPKVDLQPPHGLKEAVPLLSSPRDHRCDSPPTTTNLEEPRSHR
jgi:hypothetical protein